MARPGRSDPDFTRPFGTALPGRPLVILLEDEGLRCAVGPFADLDEATRWAQGQEVTSEVRIYQIERPEDWPGAGLPPIPDPPEPGPTWF